MDSQRILEQFRTASSSVTIPFSISLDIPGLSLLHQLLAKSSLISELIITGQSLDPAKVKVLYSILESRPGLKRLVLSNNKIAGRDSLEYLCAGVKSSSVEYLDLSNNKITDECVEFLSDMLENSRLLALNLDSNFINKGNLAQVLSKNERIQLFSINFNPLSYEFVSDLLSSLMFNKSLKTLSMKGIKLEGPAPIKENSSGHLSKQEAVILKLAYVLRFASCSSVSIDIKGTLDVQLAELEKTLVKYNNKLTTLSSDLIDWKAVPSNSVLGVIAKALKANFWIQNNLAVTKENQDDLPADIEELVQNKLNSQNKSENNESFLSYIESESIEPKTSLKKHISYICSIHSSPSSPKFKSKKPEFRSFPLTYSAETPQFMTAAKGISFSPELKNMEKIQDLEDFSSIDFEEKRCTPVKMRNEKQFEEMWKMMKNLEKSLSAQVELLTFRVSSLEEKQGHVLKKVEEINEGKTTERHEKIDRNSEEKAIWAAIGRVEKFMTSASKKDLAFEKRLENVEDEAKTCRESIQKLKETSEEQKNYFQENLREKTSKLDLELLEKKFLKISNKLNFLTSDLDNIRRDSTRGHLSLKNLDSISQEVSKLKERETSRSSELLKTFEAFQKELMAKYLIIESKVADFSREESKNFKFERNSVSPLQKLSVSPLQKSTIPTLDIPKALRTSNSSIEEMRKRAAESSKSPLQPCNEGFLPGEAESLVMSAIMERANSSRLMQSMRKVNKSPIGFRNKLTLADPENIPSAQLQETLRLRGIPYDSKGALTERRK